MFLADYLDAATNRPWVWGASDCCFFGGDWIRAATDRDPLAPYRGAYSTAAEAGRLIMRAGGLVRLVEAEMRRCGFVRALVAEHGDIAVLAVPTHGADGPARASVVIADGPWWLGRTLDGYLGTRAEPAAIWRVLGSVR